jgi:hypothetical protein
MKTLRIFFATFVVLFLSVGISNAKGNKTTTTETYYWEDYMPCNYDFVHGWETWIVTEWDGKWQLRAKGTYEGESGKCYTWSMLQNQNWKNYVAGKVYTETYIGTSVIECEGVPFAIYKYRYHITKNAKGELVVEFERTSGDDWICL